MPHSLRDNDQDVRAYVKESNIRSLLDVGAGSGTYGRLLHDLVPHRSAVEIFSPYVTHFDLHSVYPHGVIEADVRTLAQNNTEYSEPFDLIILGDVLEHMTADEAVEVWAWASTVARRGLISGPIVEWHQDAVNGNEHERHVQENLIVSDYERLFGPFTRSFVYMFTATFIKEFHW